MQVETIVTFVRVVQLKSFSLAARALGTRKSTVSSRVAALEKDLGVTLLKRTTRSVRPTDAGLAYFTSATRALQSLQEMDAVVGGAQRELSGRLRVSTAGTGDGWVGDLLYGFLSAYPGIRVELVLEERRVDLLSDDFDAAIRFGKLADMSDVVAKRVATVVRGLFASPAYLSHRPPPAHPRELAGYDVLWFEGSRGSLDLVSSATGEPFRAMLSVPRFSANKLTALRHQAVAGLGIVNLPLTMVHEDLEHERLVRVLPDWASAPDPINVIYPKQRFVPAKLRAFVDHAARFARQSFAPAPRSRRQAR